MATSRKAPTIQDVARQAQVSTATVSRALSSPERVSEAARERIAAAVHSTGFTLNETARSLRRRAVRTIVIAFPNVGNSFYSTILDAVVNEAASRGYAVLAANRLGEDPTQWLREYFRSNRADGMVLFDGSLHVDQLYELRTPQGKFPLVLSSDELPDDRLHSVMTDNRKAAADATRYLIGLGHRHIGHIHTPSKTPGLVSNRLLGFQDAMTEAGIDIRREWVLEGDFTIESGWRAADSLLAMRERPTAIFAGNDEMAIGCISRLAANNVLCPRDISVVGFDDISVASSYLPALTTVRQPRAEIGRLATRTLVDILEGEGGARPPVRIVLKSELIVRDSAAPPRGQ